MTDFFISWIPRLILNTWTWLGSDEGLPCSDLRIPGIIWMQLWKKGSWGTTEDSYELDTKISFKTLNKIRLRRRIIMIWSQDSRSYLNSTMYDLGFLGAGYQDSSQNLMRLRWRIIMFWSQDSRSSRCHNYQEFSKKICWLLKE